MSATKSEVVVFDVKPSLMRQPLRRMVCAGLTAREALTEMLRTEPTGDQERRAIKQLKNETAGRHDFLALTAAGNLVKIDADRTTLAEIAVLRVIRSGEGKLDKLPVVSCDVQAYAPVGQDR